MRRDKKKVRYKAHICVCGHEVNAHDLGFFTQGRPCRVPGCDCTEYSHGRDEHRERWV